MQNSNKISASLSQHALDAIKPSGLLGKKIIFYDELSSTFDKIKELPLTEGLTVVCAKQTNGFGRLGRTWESNKGGIYFTFALTPPFGNFEIPFVTIVCALGVCRALRDFLPCSIKWPNDIVCKSKKICGILTKTIAENGKISALLVGIGVNVNNDRFDVPHAASLKTITGKTYDENIILRKILEETEFVYTHMTAGDIITEYKKHCVNLGRQVTIAYKGKEISGICTDIQKNGSMTFSTETESIDIHSGEVSVKGIYE